MKLYVESLEDVSPVTNDKGSHKLLCLHADMSRTMLEENIVSMLGHLTQEQAQNLLMDAFPELFDTEKEI